MQLISEPISMQQGQLYPMELFHMDLNSATKGYLEIAVEIPVDGQPELSDGYAVESVSIQGDVKS